MTPQGTGFICISFSNVDGKQWAIQRRRMKVGLELYQPSSVKGKLLKRCLPYGQHLIAGGGLFHAEYAELFISPELKRLLTQYFGSNFECSAFFGTPCVDQKVTVQISHGKRLLGYCKIGKTNRVFSLLEREKFCMDIMEHCNVEQVPRCLCLTVLSNGHTVLLQTTEKECGNRTEHVFGRKHAAFLKQMFEKTKQRISFYETDYADVLIRLKSNFLFFSEAEREVLEKACEIVRVHYSEKEQDFGMCHGDFTPWNSCLVKEKLYVFDFEYALVTAPEGLDYWHFIIQTALFEKRKTNMELIEDLRRRRLTEREKISLVAYLLQIIDLYLYRGAEPDLEVARCRCDILSAVICDMFKE